MIASGFNTTLVQLKDSPGLYKDGFRQSRFNTTLVQLKGNYQAEIGWLENTVSIPHWSN